MIWTAIAFSLVMQTGASSRPHAGFAIYPRACEDDYVFIENVTGRLKSAQDGKLRTTQIDSIHNDLIFTVEPKPTLNTPPPDWKSIKLTRDESDWKYEVSFQDGSIQIVTAKTVRVNSNFSSLWNLLSSSKVDGQNGALLQKCDLGNCRTQDGKEKFTKLSGAQVPKPTADVQYRLSVQGKDDKEARVQFDLDQSYLGLRKSWIAQARTNPKQGRLPHFTNKEVCVLVDKSGVCKEDEKMSVPKDSETLTVMDRKELKTDSEEFKKAEKTFNDFTNDLHLDVTETLQTARAKKPIVLKPAPSPTNPR